MVDFREFPGLPLHDTQGKPFCHGGFANAGFTDEQRVVLAPPAQDLHGSLDFLFAADQWIDLVIAGALVEVGGELFQRAGFLSRRLLLPLPALMHRLRARARLPAC